MANWLKLGSPCARSARHGTTRRRNAGRRRRSKAASVGGRDLALACAGIAFDRIDFVTRLYRLHYGREARSIAVRADTLFDLRLHVEPFWPRLNWANRKGPLHARPLAGLVSKICSG